MATKIIEVELEEYCPFQDVASDDCNISDAGISCENQWGCRVPDCPLRKDDVLVKLKEGG